ncbi:Retrovirusrelated Pol Polyprotein [Phytophthora palmivora]|uniref:Retrovirusrelated Pol Polyprotein n=1 Tax=Phytophthora palmivora TaxID=4796 RepID=A0A2P4Y0U0_9STRA|nr:Retrovirusrelated Pol Polyprotein [Phytophthora palmivora]
MIFWWASFYYRNLAKIDIDRQLGYLTSRKVGDNDTCDDPEDMSSSPSEPDNVVRDGVNALVRDAIERSVVEINVTDRLFTVVRRFDDWRLEIKLKADVGHTDVRFDSIVQEILGSWQPSTRNLLSLGEYMSSRKALVLSDPTCVETQHEWIFRKTIDYRLINALTAPIAGLMPQHCRGKVYYAMFDFLQGFWQLPLHESCEEWLSYMTGKRVFTPMRVPQVTSPDAVLYFQSTVEMVLSRLVNECVVVWIDNLLVLVDTASELLCALKRFSDPESLKERSGFDRRKNRYDPERALRAMLIPWRPSTILMGD